MINITLQLYFLIILYKEIHYFVIRWLANFHEAKRLCGLHSRTNPHRSIFKVEKECIKAWTTQKGKTLPAKRGLWMKDTNKLAHGNLIEMF